MNTDGEQGLEVELNVRAEDRKKKNLDQVLDKLDLVKALDSASQSERNELFEAQRKPQ